MTQPGLSTLVLNANDPESQRWAAYAPSHVEMVWIGVAQQNELQKLTQDRHCFATKVNYHEAGCGFTLQSSWGQAQVNIPLFGAFNLFNLLSAMACLLAENERFEEVIQAVNRISPVAGRMEVFQFNHAANVIVDYAHTPDALEKVLSSARAHTHGKVWCVFGCGGDRDKGKRPLMASAAESGADFLVITTDNSRSEAAEDIAKDIMAGLNNPATAISEPDRERAIRYCLDNASPEDIVIAAGKGHEDYQIIGTQQTDYNERAVVARLQQEFSK